jgi:hypothetical protein
VTPILRHLGRRLVMQLYARPSLVLIAAAIVALSVASGERTFEGMKNFFEGMENVTAAVVLSALITFGVQVLMVVLAWRIGEVLSTSSQVGTSEPSQQRKSFIGENGHLRRFISRQFLVRNFTLIASFLICATICVFFSFDAFYRGISTEAQRGIAAQGDAIEILRKIDTELTQQLESAEESAATELASGRDWEEYKKRVNDVVAVATDPAFAQVQAQRAKEHQTQDAARVDEFNRTHQAAEIRKNEAAASRDQFASAERDLELELKRLDEARSKLEGRRNELRESISQQKDKVEKALVKRDNEDKTGNGELSPKGVPNIGRGLKYRQYDADYKGLNNELDSLKRRESELSAEIEINKTNRELVDKRFQRTKLDHANAIAAFDAITIPAITQTSPVEPPVTILAPDEEARKLDVAVTTFLVNRTRQNWAATERQCGKVVQMIRETPGGGQRADRLDCAPSSGLRTSADRLGELEQRRANLKSTCTDVDARQLTFLQIVDHGRYCLQVAQVQGQSVTMLETALDKLRLERDQNAHTFTKTLVGFERGDKLAYLSAIIALGLDGLVFIAGIWGARSSVSPLTRSGDATAAEIDDDAEMTMATEVRPEGSRPTEGWPEPAEVYKARVFMRHLHPYSNREMPEMSAIISTRTTSGMERDAIKSVLSISPFAAPLPGGAPESEMWLVTDRLVRYVTRVAASYDRLQRHTAATRPPHAPTYRAEVSAGSDSDPYGAIAALAGNGGMAGDQKSADEHIDAGYRTRVDAPSAGGNAMVGSGIRHSDSDPPGQVTSEAKSPPTRSQGSRRTEAAPGYGYAEHDR